MQEMATFIREFAKMNHSTFDCVILAILTHGVEGALYGVDEKKLAVEDVFKYFDATRAPTLIGKPKIVILQACRGGRLLVPSLGFLVSKTQKSRSSVPKF